ncbi:MAG: CpsD/CapB family tyrosine-protein kinase [Clostridia bacterium]|nr:CpsD/CapB family tyrosine-protein kinase [Clostridia bacterium]
MQFPFSKKNSKHNLHVISDADLITKNPDASLSEALKAARINLMYTLSEDEEEKGKALLVTSAFSAEGKTTTCINLAATLAQTEAKVLLIDADLRKPRIHSYLGVKNQEGLANHLGGFSSIESVIRRMNEFNFDYITAGNIPPNPAELLSSKKFSALVEQLREHYDYIIFDTPPVNAVADVLSVVAAIENVVFICRCGISITSEVKKAISALEFAHAKILGFITINAQGKKTDNYSTYSSYYYYR